MNDMDQTMGTGDAARHGVDRRTMLKAAVAAGTVAGTWVAPRIESLGFAPAGAATPCIILSPASDDKESQSGQSYCPIVTEPCCGQSFGNAGQVDRFTFTNPAPNCSQIVVRTIALNCNSGTGNPERNPDVGQFAVVIESTTGAGCGVCQVLDAVIIESSMRTILNPPLNNGPVSCPPAGQIGDGVDASIACNDPRLVPSSRLAVRLTCNVSGTCP
ncbi:MAG: hypothetical protein AB1679_05225 [Actinomycetota bacterium]|jgi:hypothetical protein